MVAIKQVSRGRVWRLALLALGALVLVGCLSDEDSPEACRFAVSQDLDAGRYDRALERIDSRACQAGMTRDQRELNRAAAWIGKAGYDFGDVLDVVLGRSRLEQVPQQATRILSALRGQGNEPRALEFLDRAEAAHARMVDAFPGGLEQACRRSNRHLLNDLQLDACFTSGIMAYGRFVRSLDLLLSSELGPWLDIESLTCANDRNRSGVLDEAEIAACAIAVQGDLAAGSGTCREVDRAATGAVGAVRWAVLPQYDPLLFRNEYGVFASLRPLRITVEAGPVCSGERSAIRLVQETPPPADLVVTDGFCELDVTRGCDAADPLAGCWPCPQPRAERAGAITLEDAVIEALNIGAAHLLAAVSEAELERSLAQLEEVRGEICEAAAAEGMDCPITAEGRLAIDRGAVEALLRR